MVLVVRDHQGLPLLGSERLEELVLVLIGLLDFVSIMLGDINF